MLIRFTCKAYENTTYFQSVAKHLLALMGHSGAIPGAIKAKDVAQALNNLQQGMDKELHKPTQANSIEQEEEEPLISLTNRALPLINMLKAAIKEECDVLWDYTKL